MQESTSDLGGLLFTNKGNKHKKKKKKKHDKDKKKDK